MNSFDICLDYLDTLLTDYKYKFWCVYNKKVHTGFGNYIDNILKYITNELGYIDIKLVTHTIQDISNYLIIEEIKSFKMLLHNGIIKIISGICDFTSIYNIDRYL
jgi:hypothetical protein